MHAKAERKANRLGFDFVWKISDEQVCVLIRSQAQGLRFIVQVGTSGIPLSKDWLHNISTPKQFLSLHWRK
jgi:hypothetical protein